MRRPSAPLLLILIAALMLLSGCYERETIQLDWSRDWQEFELEIQYHNVEARLFDCQGDASACVERIRSLIQNDVLQLGDQGARNIQQRLILDGDALHVQVRARAPAELAIQFGVQVEAEGRPGRERVRMVLEGDAYDGAVDLPRAARRRVASPQEGGESWVLRPRHRTVTIEHSYQPGESILVTYPELPRLLEEAGLL